MCLDVNLYFVALDLFEIQIIRWNVNTQIVALKKKKSSNVLVKVFYCISSTIVYWFLLTGFGFVEYPTKNSFLIWMMPWFANLRRAYDQTRFFQGRQNLFLYCGESVLPRAAVSLGTAMHNLGIVLEKMCFTFTKKYVSLALFFKDALNGH